jgi:16S rRNA (guanine966-N2)-methyltransferase
MTRTVVEDSLVTDLFSGTGFVSYEFCSRGAQKVVAVEKDRRCIAFIRQSIELLQLENLHVFPGDVFRFLQQQPTPADIVFADPPYAMENINTLPDVILDHGAVKPDGILILEHGNSNRFTHHPNFTEERKYGNVCFSFFSGTARPR